jgi:hypothetical protein
MIRIEPFAPEHLARLDVRPEQRGDAERLHQAGGAAAERGPAFTAFDEAGAVVGCAGLAENGPDYATAWAMFADGLRPAIWAGLTRAIAAVLETSGYRRIDMLVRADFPAAHRFARALGFEQDMILFARHDEPLLQCSTRNVPRGEEG